MDRHRIPAAAILIVCMFIIINNSSTIAAEHEREVESSKPWLSDKLRNLISFSTSSPATTTSYWGKLKTLMNRARAYFIPPNIDFRGGGKEAEATVSDGGGSAGEKVKEAVAKSLEKSRATVEDSAKSAAKVAKEKLKKSSLMSSQPPLKSEL